jgi:hypothetical protein
MRARFSRRFRDISAAQSEGRGLASSKLPQRHQNGTDLVMTANRASTSSDAVPRTIRFPRRLRQRIADDAVRCGRSFEAHVIAVLRHHYGEDVDIAPVPAAILALARGSLADMTSAAQRSVTRRLRER